MKSASVSFKSPACARWIMSTWSDYGVAYVKSPFGCVENTVD